MLLKEKTNLSWLYEEYINETLSESEINEILKDFGYDFRTRVALLECMMNNKEEADIVMWQGLLEDDVEEAYAEGEVGWI